MNVPKMRINGFEGEWKRVKLAECLNISNDTNKDNIYEATKELLTDKEVYKAMSTASNPYGDGFASKYIVDIIIDRLYNK